MRDESEKEIVHRLEAFSDIVIGFSLAQLSLSLTLPRHHASELFHVHGAVGIFAFVVTFMLICGVWWMHHRLFRHLFVPTPPNIVANFAALGGVIFLAYSMQVLVHVGISDPEAFPMYTGSYAWIVALFAVIAWNGIRLRAAQMSEQLHIDSIHHAVRLSIIALWLTLMTLATGVFGVRPEVAQWGFFVLIIPLAINRFLNARRLRSVAPSRS